MYEISLEEFEQYYQECQDFEGCEVPQCGVVIYWRANDKELVAIDDGDKYYCKDRYWEVKL